LEEYEPARVVWIDFSSASTEASEKDLALEKEKVIEYFRDSVISTRKFG
jgi:hypothetical protein